MEKQRRAKKIELKIFLKRIVDLHLYTVLPTDPWILVGWFFLLAKKEKHCHWLLELARMLGSYLSINSILHYPSFSYLGHNDSRSQVKLLHDASVKLLDIVYLKYEEIYSKLCMAATGETCINDRQKLSVLANDLMLLAVSVIGAASFIVNQGTSDMVSCSIHC